jgi:hypothetical protein
LLDDGRIRVVTELRPNGGNLGVGFLDRRLIKLELVNVIRELAHEARHVGACLSVVSNGLVLRRLDALWSAKIESCIDRREEVFVMLALGKARRRRI